jgi:hypothetical protein
MKLWKAIKKEGVGDLLASTLGTERKDIPMSSGEATHEAVMQAEDLSAPRETPGLSKNELAELIDAIHKFSPWRDANGIAAYLGMDVKTIHALTGPNAIGPESLPYHRLTEGGRKRFHIGEVDEWLLGRT